MGRYCATVVLKVQVMRMIILAANAMSQMVKPKQFQWKLMESVQQSREQF